MQKIANIKLDQSDLSVANELANLFSETLFNELDITFNQLEHKLNTDQQKLVKKILAIDPKSLGVKAEFIGLSEPKSKRFKINKRKIKVNDKKTFTQKILIPEHAWLAWQKLHTQLKNDTGLELIITSGYRSPAYQALLLIYYLDRNQYNESVLKRVATPGFSQHGDYDKPALDIWTPDKQSGASKNFAETAQYKWLAKYAQDFGFILPYGENNSLGYDFEPWHWRFVGLELAKET